MESINTWVACLNGSVDVCSFKIPTYFVFSKVEWDDLLECKLILDNDYAAVILVVSILVKILFLMLVCQFRFAYSYTEFLFAMLTYKHKRLTL